MHKNLVSTAAEGVCNKQVEWEQRKLLVAASGLYKNSLLTCYLLALAILTIAPRANIWEAIYNEKALQITIYLHCICIWIGHKISAFYCLSVVDFMVSTVSSPIYGATLSKILPI